MNKTISVTIAGLVFNIDEDAYASLHNYLEAVKKHFSGTDYGPEVYGDIEARIAEQFTKKIETTKVQSITISDVDAVIKAMGTVADFETVENKKTETAPKTTKRLYRDPDNMMIAGVASGLAAYLGWDVTLIRILFVVTVLTGGWGAVLYVLLWLLIPMAETPSEKLEMRGSPVTLAQLEQTVRQKFTDADNSKSPNQSRLKLGKLVSSFFLLVGRIIKALFKVGSSVLGGFMAAGFTIAAFGLTMVAVILLFNPNSPYIDSQLTHVFPGSDYFIALAAIYATIVIPLVFMVLLGVMLFTKKNVFNNKAAGAVAIVWLLAAFTSGAMFFKAAPKIEEISNSPVQTKTRSLQFSNFDKIQTGGEFDVKVVPGAKYSISLVGREEDVDQVQARVENQTFIISRQDKFQICFFCFNDSMTLEVTMPNLSSANLQGSSTLSATGFRPENFELRLSGASRAELGIFTKEFKSNLSGSSRLTITGEADKFTADLSGASRLTGELKTKNDLNLSASGGSRMTLTGEASALKVKLSGAARFEGADMKTKIGEVTASGGSRAYIYASESITGNASGGSHIYYQGTSNVNIKTSGGSDVENF